MNPMIPPTMRMEIMDVKTSAISLDSKPKSFGCERMHAEIGQRIIAREIIPQFLLGGSLKEKNAISVTRRRVKRISNVI